MIQWRMIRYSDLVLWGVVVFLLMIGLLSQFSMSQGVLVQEGGAGYTFFLRHISSILIAMGVAGIFLYWDYHHIKRIIWPVYIVSLLLLLGVEFIGVEIGGAVRWLSLGPLSIQPSEIAKFATVGCIAHYLSSRKKDIRTLWEIFVVTLIALPSFLLILRQPDLGTALTVLLIAIGIIFFAVPSLPIRLLFLLPFASILFRANIFIWIVYIIVSTFFLFGPRIQGWIRWSLIALNAAAGAVFPLFWNFLQPYQQQRILTFLQPELDPLGTGYQTLQSKIAIGSGGIFGRGFTQGTQTQLSFVPQQPTDFIFAGIGEEWGLIGGIILISLFALLIIRALKISLEAPDAFGEILAGGYMIFIGIHICVNLAMALGLFPVVGVPLPFISIGGTSLLMHLVAIAILQSIAMRSNQIFF